MSQLTSKNEITAITPEKRAAIFETHRKNGVCIPLEDGIIITENVKIGEGTLLLPGTILRGGTVIGKDCEIGPNSYLENATVGDECRVISTYIDSSTLEDGVKIGPMSNVRPNCHISAKAKIGDFVEIKNSTIGENTAVAHLTYVGDTDVGARCNFGCGVVTVNYDGKNKYRTTIGDDVFIGCNVNLISPVEMGNGSYAAAGTTITDNVPENSLAIGRSRQTVKENWSDGKFSKK